MALLVFTLVPFAGLTHPTPSAVGGAEYMQLSAVVVPADPLFEKKTCGCTNSAGKKSCVKSWKTLAFMRILMVILDPWR